MQLHEILVLKNNTSKKSDTKCTKENLQNSICTICTIYSRGIININNTFFRFFSFFSYLRRIVQQRVFKSWPTACLLSFLPSPIVGFINSPEMHPTSRSGTTCSPSQTAIYSKSLIVWCSSRLLVVCMAICHHRRNNNTVITEIMGVG